jgi:tight adherence protein C
MVELAISNWLFRSAALLAIFGAVVGLAYMLVLAGSRRASLKSGLKQIEMTGGMADTRSARLLERDTIWARVAEQVEKSGVSLNDSDNDALRLNLSAAGYTGPNAPKIYTLTRLILVFLLPGIFLLILTSREEPPTLFTLYLVSGIMALLGLYLPNLYVRAKADRRRQEIVNGFPDCLDLLLVCVEAGLGLEAAMDRVGREMVTTHPLVAGLLIGTTYRLRAGASREDALRHLSTVAGVPEIRSFSTLLIQSDKLGTSISTTLRIYAGEMREARRLRAEERAHRLPVIISVPLVACMLPTMIGVLVLPAAIRFIRDVAPAMAG